MARKTSKIGLMLGSKKLAAIGLERSLDIFRNIKDLSAPAIDFLFVMSKVQAITGASNIEMEELNDTARQLGATTAWKASQAAEAMSYLGCFPFLLLSVE